MQNKVNKINHVNSRIIGVIFNTDRLIGCNTLCRTHIDVLHFVGQPIWTQVKLVWYVVMRGRVDADAWSMIRIQDHLQKITIR